ncbi:MAG: D-tyrosyl-tRNA(Tyr) deacylase [Chthonomonas sp.]|nr:D-tyrosyl-tRNA(Tyr) deacylase [Chthonomonas sp.]
MRAIVQRVAWARVSVNGNLIGQCGSGLLVLAGAHREDTATNAVRLADRLVKLRIFNDADGKMNLALGEGQGMLVVSNFTVYGETAKNRRPSFTESAPYEKGQELIEHLVAELRKAGISVETGEFGADMQVELLNDGPVTVIVEG